MLVWQDWLRSPAFWIASGLIVSAVICLAVVRVHRSARSERERIAKWRSATHQHGAPKEYVRKQERVVRPAPPSKAAQTKPKANAPSDQVVAAIARPMSAEVDDDLLFAATAREIAEAEGHVVGEIPASTALNEWQGRLVHRIPGRMVQGITELVEVRIGSDGMPQLAVGLVGSGSLKTATLPIVSSMRVDLIADPACFRIVPKSEPMQFVQPMQAASMFVAASEPFGRWLWDVTGKKAGTHKLTVRVSGQATNASGGVSTAALPPRDFPVTVRIGYAALLWSGLKKVLGGLAIAAIGGLAAGFTRDFWWPRLSALLQAWGWL